MARPAPKARQGPLDPVVAEFVEALALAAVRRENRERKARLVGDKHATDVEQGGAARIRRQLSKL